MKSNIEALPKISFDLGGVATLNKSFATGETIFAHGDPARTLMYIQKGRVKLSVASKTDKEAIVAILGPRISWRNVPWPSESACEVRYRDRTHDSTSH